VIELLLNEMKEQEPGTIFLIDAFPTSLDKLDVCKKYFGEPRMVIYLTCDEEVRVQRLLRRGITSLSVI
jgi:adenylate kinase family enzyme